MELIVEGPGSRIYKLDDGSHREVRPQLRALRGEMRAAPEYPEVEETAVRMLVEQMERWFQTTLHEQVGNTEVYQDRYDHIVYLTDDEGNYLLDEDGQYIVDPEFPDPIPMVIFRVEAGYWPHPLEEIS